MLFPLTGDLEAYQKTAEGLFDAGYYSGLVSGIESSLREPGTFVILDCPSGTGKTLAGVALSMQGCNNRADSKLKLDGRPAYVYHLMWLSAVIDQRIYQDICNSSKANSAFFDNFAQLDAPITAESLSQFLQSSLPGLDSRDIAVGHKVLLLIIDEVPDDSEAIHRLCRIRDTLKELPNVCVFLCGTHSKAANMVGLTQGVASRSNNSDPVPWAWIITRLPKFDLEIAGLEKCWTELSRRDGSEHICKAIHCSLSNGGNPLLILLAIKSAVNMDTSNDSAKAFRTWQVKFGLEVLAQKINGNRISHQFKGLIGQLNLLLDATATAHLSDMLLGHHFAFRCIPDHGESCGANRGAA